MDGYIPIQCPQPDGSFPFPQAPPQVPAGDSIRLYGEVDVESPIIGSGIKFGGTVVRNGKIYISPSSVALESDVGGN